MNSNIVDRITELKYRTATNVYAVNRGYLPSINHIDLMQTWEYTLDGITYNMQNENCTVFITNSLPYKFNISRETFRDSFLNLVLNNEMYPFTTFLGGLYVNIHDIEIVRDRDASYIIINNTYRPDDICTTVSFGGEWEFKENLISTQVSPRDSFVLNSSGKFVVTPTPDTKYSAIRFTNPNFIFKKGVGNFMVNVDSGIDSKYVLQKNNIFIFRDGKLIDNPCIVMKGLNMFEVNDDEPRYMYSWIAFVNTEENAIDNAMNITNDIALRNKVIDNNKSKKFLSILKEPMDFNFSRKYTYNMNMRDTLEYLMDYNPLLLMDALKKESNVITKSYTGAYLKTIKQNNGYICMSRRLDSLIDNYVMIFCNGEIWRNYKELVYKNMYFIFPCTFNDDDEVEIIFFKNVDNTEYPIKLPDGEPVTLDPGVRIKDMELFTMSPYEKHHKTEYKPSVQYRVPFTFEENGDSSNSATIIPDNGYYVDKELTMVSSRQFRYSFAYIGEDKTIGVKLPEKFKYAKDHNKYKVFVNRRLINSVDYKLTIPTEKQPFTDVSIYFTMLLNKGDTVEVFYLPESLESVYYNDKLSSSGHIVIDQSKLSMPFDKESYMVFVNGKKVPIEDIKNISSNRLQISKTTQSLKRVEIFRNIDYDNFVDFCTIFAHNGGDIPTNVYNNLPEERINELYKEVDIFDNEPDFSKGNKERIPDILEKIVKDVWCKPFINDGGLLVYNYDEGLQKDKNGVNISHAANADSKML